MPVIHPYAGGNQGTSHGSDYYIADPIAACVDSAKLQLAMLHMLLSNGGARAKEIAANYKAPFTISEYLEYMDSLCDSGDRIEYGENEAKVRI